MAAFYATNAPAQAAPKNRRRHTAPRSNALALEARTLFDGAAVVTATEVAAGADNTRAHDAPAERSPANPAATTDHSTVDTALTTDHSTADTAPATDHSTADTAPATDVATSAAPASTRHEIAFVDPAVAGWQNIVAAIRPGVDVVVLDPARDAFAQIADAVNGGVQVDAVHIISHGGEGALVLGGLQLDLAALPGDLQYQYSSREPGPGGRWIKRRRHLH